MSLPKLKLQDLKNKPNFKIWPEQSDDFKFEKLDDTAYNEKYNIRYGDFDNITPDDVMEGLKSKSPFELDGTSKNPDPYGHPYKGGLNRLDILNPQDFNEMN
jgi:hypothetical protein